jgi:tetratricopeptide (TPR) repeat protein
MSKNILFLAITFLIFGCRTSNPKRTNPDRVTGIQNGKSFIDNLPLESEPGVGVPLVWSPAERKANATFQYLLAQKFIVSGDINAALPVLESSYNLDPNSYAGAQVVEAKLITGHVDEALEESHRMTLLYPKDARLSLQYGQVLAFKQDIDESIVQLKRAIELDPKLEDAYIVLARLYATKKQPKEAVATVQKLTKAIPSTSKGWAMMTKLLIAQKKYKDALDPARRNWNLQSNQPEAALLLGVTLDLNGKQKDAVALYEQLYRINPANVELLGRMVALYQEVGNLSDALSLIEDAMAQSKEPNPGLVMQKALILSELGRHNEAAMVLDDLYKQHPESDRIAFLSGMAFEKLKQFDAALDRFRSIQDDSPLKLTSEYRIALIFKQQGHVDEALKHSQSLTTRNDADATTWQLYIELLADGNRVDDALKQCQIASEKFPDQIQLLFLKGVYEEKLQRLTDAEETMRKIIKKKPDHASALNFLGYMLAEQNKNLDEAEALVTKALKIKPEEGSYLDSLGWVYYQKGDFKRALETLKKASQLSPKEGVISEHIGDTYLKLGDKISAFQSYNQALQTELEPRDKKRIEKKFNALKGGELK